MVLDCMVSLSPFLLISALFPLISVTIVLTRIVTPSFVRNSSALSANFFGYVGRTWFRPSTKIIFASSVFIFLKSSFNVVRVSSPIVPANSTPVGPAPIIKKVIHSCCFLGSVSLSAASKDRRIFLLISRASSTVFNPGAFCAQSSWPK